MPATLRKPWTARLAYTAASFFLVFHSIALFLGPGPASYTMGHVYPLFSPYLRFLNLDNEWGFFAPDPHAGSIPRYVLKTQDGQARIYRLTEALHRSDPAFLRHASLYTTISRQVQPYTDAAADYLCRRHAGQQPESVQFFVGHQIRLSREQWLAGARPLDDAYMDIEYLAPRPCP